MKHAPKIASLLALMIVGLLADTSRANDRGPLQSTTLDLLLKQTGVHDKSKTGTSPDFVVDPTWPQPLPRNWLLGQIGGLYVTAWHNASNPTGIVRHSRMRADVADGSRAVILAMSKSHRLCLRKETSARPAVAKGHVWTAPGWQEESSLQHWSVRPCVRRVCAGLRFCRRIRASVSPSFRETFVARLYSFRSIGL